MRVCFISRRFFPAISGMSVYALNLIRQMAAEGHDVVMVSQYRNDDAGAAVYGGGPPPEVPGVKIIGLESHGEQVVGDDQPADFEADIEAIVSAVEREHADAPFDIIHAQYGYPTGLAALEASRRLGVPNVVSIQGGDGHWVGTCCDTHRDAMRAVLHHAGEVLIGSLSFAKEVHENHHVPLDRFTIIPGATDTDRFHPAGGKELGSLSDPPTFLYHGRVDARKGLIEMIDAMAIVHDAIPAARMVVSGIGPDVDAIRDHAAKCGLAGVVDFLGYTEYEQAPTVYHRGDIFVSPTYSEGFSNTILEAMASGLPVISTETVGVVDCLTHDDNGYLVPIREVEPLAAAMIRMIEDDGLRTRLACRGYDDVVQKYSWPVIGNRIIRRYDGLVGGAIDNDWTDLYDPETVTAETADASCRFRAAPHLL